MIVHDLFSPSQRQEPFLLQDALLALLAPDLAATVRVPPTFLEDLKA